MQLKSWLETTGYRITEGNDYYWDCYENCYSISYWDDPSTFSTTVTYNRKTQEIYEIETYDYSKNNFYRWFNESYREAYFKAAEQRNIDPTEAFDDEKFIDLEVEEDILDKTRAIVNGREYDDRVLIPLTLDDDTLLELFKQAHARDITFNQFILNILQEQIDRLI